MNKNVKYGLIFTGVVAGSYIVVKIIQNVRDAIAAKGDKDEAEKVIAELESTGTTTNASQSPYAKLFALAKADSSVKADVQRIQTLHNDAVALKKQGSKIGVDGWFGKNTYSALNSAPFAVQSAVLDSLVKNPTAAGVRNLKNTLEGTLSNYRKTAGTKAGVSNPADLPWNKPATPKSGQLFDWLNTK